MQTVRQDDGMCPDQTITVIATGGQVFRFWIMHLPDFPLGRGVGAWRAACTTVFSNAYANQNKPFEDVQPNADDGMNRQLHNVLRRNATVQLTGGHDRGN